MKLLPLGTATAVIAMVVSACHAKQIDNRPTRPVPSGSARTGQYLIEGEELAASPGENLYEVVRLRRPVWLERSVRNATGDAAVAVYFDERYLGPLSILRQMPVRVAARMRYLAPTEAQLRFGPQHGSRAAIVIDSKR